MSDDPHGQTNQPLPKANNPYPAVHDLLVADIQARDKYGQGKYGQRLRPFNGRNSLRDAYEEVIDLAVYLRVLMYESQFNVLNQDAVDIRDIEAVKFERDAWVNLLTRWRGQYEIKEDGRGFVAVPMDVFNKVLGFAARTAPHGKVGGANE